MNHAVLTLDGTVQSLAEAITDLQTNFPVQYVKITSPNGNAVVYVGGQTSYKADHSAGDALSATSYGDLLDATAAADSVEYGPFDTGVLDLNAIFVLGTDTQKLHFMWVGW